MDFNQLCNDFLKSNEKIRFVGVINSSGNLTVQKNRKDTTSLLSEDETNMLVHYSFSRWKRLQNIQHKLGEIKETITKFEKVNTIMLFFNENLFLISTEPKSNNSKIISELWKIIDRKPVNRKPAKTSKSKKRPARKTATKSTRKAAKKRPARKTAKTSKSKKPISGISKKDAKSDLTSKLEQLEKRANLLYQKFKK